MRFFPLLSLPLIAFVSACGAPVRNTPIDEIAKLPNIEEVMYNQATVADPEWKMIGAEAYTDADYARFQTVSERLQATAAKTKSFSKGPDFDALADRLAEKAKALGTAAAAKDKAASSTAIAEIKATCKECHSKFR